MENNITTGKAVVTALLGALTSLFGALTIPILLMVLCNVIDYLTGIVAAKYRAKKIKSDIGIRGIAKKICMWLLVVVGVIIDQLLLYTSSTIGFSIPFTFLVSCIVAIWIICNEIISILENIVDIGVPIPAFLLPLVKNIKDMVEDKTELKESEDEQV